MARNEIRCSFCGKTESQVLKLLKGPNGVYICDACVELCSEIIEEELSEDVDSFDEEEINLLKPEEIKEFLDDYVIGQENAKIDSGEDTECSVCHRGCDDADGGRLRRRGCGEYSLKDHPGGRL